MPRTTQRTALILNFTGNVYHWGCHGTSAEIYQSLIEREYQVNWLDVRTTHTLNPAPGGIADFTSASFFATFFKLHPNFEFALQEADVVVVNGEGTLHHLGRAPINLLFLIHAAANIFKKPVHLINHSFFPSGDFSIEPEADKLYGAVARSLKRVVPREPESLKILERLGVSCTQGFDCLPRYLKRRQFVGATRSEAPLVISGGVNMTPASVGRISKALQPLSMSRRLIFLTGAKTEPAAEDRLIYNHFVTHFPGIEYLDAKSMEQWVETIASASCLVSGRFHHSLAAAALDTPFVVFPSNTPKIDATCAYLDLPPPIAYEDPDFVAQVTERIAAALGGRAPLLTSTARQRMVDGAEANFFGL